MVVPILYLYLWFTIIPLLVLPGKVTVDALDSVYILDKIQLYVYMCIAKLKSQVIKLYTYETPLLISIVCFPSCYLLPSISDSDSEL